MRDIARMLRRATRTPAASLFSVFSIAMGIAATVGVYSVVRGITKPLSSPNLKEIANIYRAPLDVGKHRLFSDDDLESLRAMQRSFEHVAGWTRVRADVAIDGMGREALCEAVSGEYFEVLGVRAALGRVLRPDDNLPGSAPVVVISHALWSARFNRDVHAIGRVVQLNGQAFEVVGVAPDWFRGVDMPTLIGTQAWLPLQSRMRVLSAGHLTARPGPYLQIKGKLRAGVSFDQAAAEVRTIGQVIDQDLRRSAGRQSQTWVLVPAADVRVHESVHSVVAPLAASALLVTVVVLLVVSSNLANFQLAKGAARRHELAVKVALGASRSRLIFEELADVAVVGLLGLLGGLLVAHVFVTRVLPDAYGLGELDIVPEPLLGPPLIVAVCAMFLAIAVGALVPAFQATRLAPRTTLAQEESTVSTPRWRGRRVLVLAQVSVAAMLVNTAGFAISRMLTRTPGQDRYSEQAVVALRMHTVDHRFTSQSLDLIASHVQPGGAAAGPIVLASALPGLDEGPDFLLARSDVASETYAKVTAIAGPYFDMIGSMVHKGRSFTERDTAAADPVVVLNETAARRLFGMSDPVGRFVNVESSDATPLRTTEQRRVIGVIGDRPSAAGDRGAAFIPLDQTTSSTVLVAMPDEGNPDLARRLERWTMAALPGVTISPVRAGTLSARLDVHLTVISALTGLLGAMSLTVAIVGLFALLSHLVIQRQREMGVRMALGASPRTVHGMIVREGIQPVIGGVLFGTAGAIAAQLAIDGAPGAVDAAALAALVIVALSFLAIAALAAYLPARRAASLDVAQVLRRS